MNLGSRRVRALLRLLIFPLLFTPFGSTAEPKQAGTVHLALSGDRIAPGGILALPMVLSQTGTAPSTLIIKLAFDINTLSVCALEPSEAIGTAQIEYRQTDSGLAALFYAGETPLAEGPIATLVLEAAPDASPGTVLLVNGNSSAADATPDPLVVDVPSHTVQIAPFSNPHDADTDANGRMGFSELLRVVQLYNSGELGCDTDSEDGFTPDGEDQTCTPHDLDYAPQDWRIDLGELLRAIQFYNALKGSYHHDTSGEDGFAPGPE